MCLIEIEVKKFTSICLFEEIRQGRSISRVAIYEMPYRYRAIYGNRTHDLLITNQSLWPTELRWHYFVPAAIG